MIHLTLKNNAKKQNTETTQNGINSPLFDIIIFNFVFVVWKSRFPRLHQFLTG